LERRVVEQLIPEQVARGHSRRPSRPLRARLTRRHLAALLTAALAAGLNIAALRQADAPARVLVAARPLPAGGPVQLADLRTAEVSGDERVLRSLVAADSAERRQGWLLSRSLRPGEALRSNDLVAPAARRGMRSMSVPIEPEHAVAGTLRTGDLVDVIGVRDGAASWVLAGAEILATGDASRRDGLGVSTPYAVTLAVDESGALRLALALREGAVVLVRATGAPPLSNGAGARP
jgi:Flp pilus assembly protein CpaB